MLSKIHLVMYLMVLILVMCSACSSGSDPVVVSNDSSERFVQAEQLFIKAKCISCHGTDLQGRVGEATNLQHVGTRRTIDEISMKIAHGGNGMPSFSSKLSDPEIRLLADWLYAKK